MEGKESEKGLIIFGLINIGLVLLCGYLKVFLLSTAMILLLAAGVAVSVQSIKEARQAKDRRALALDAAALILHGLAILLYAAAFAGVILRLIVRLIQIFR